MNESNAFVIYLEVRFGCKLNNNNTENKQFSVVVSYVVPIDLSIVTKAANVSV